MIVIGATAIYFSKDFVNNMPDDIGPSLYPMFVSIITIILAILLLFNIYRSKQEDSNFTSYNLLKIGVAVLAFAIYFYLMSKIGFIISTVLFMSLFMLTLGLRDWKKNILIPIGTTIIIYYLFVIVLKIRLPEILF